MNTNNILDPITDVKPIHIIGCGAIGSNLAVMLIKLGAMEIHLWDFDRVEPHNITNQAYNECDINTFKVDSLKNNLLHINPMSKIVAHNIPYTNERLSGYVFLCVDNIETRKDIVETNKINRNIKAMFDFRMGIYDAQHYACRWNAEGIEAFKATMNFSHDEAKQNIAVSPCGTSLSVLPTIQTVVSCGVENFIKLVREKEFHKVIIVDTDAMNILTI